ncbi:MAG: 2-dehydropantoate 2-reductase [Holophaga sp.]|nr:2-dehydropantoate 2-reductase [Holophaga sp.]
MRFLILGAGGIGGYYGARLLAAGHRVRFVARGPHLEAVRLHGLALSHPDFAFTGPVDACSAEALCRDCPADDFDLAILTVKSGATLALLEQLGAWLQRAPGLPLLSLQNGVDNEPAIEAAVGRERTLGGLAVRIGGHVVAPGRVEAVGPAQILMGAWPDAASNPALVDPGEGFAGVFRAAGIPAQSSPDIRRELWRKLLINNGVNPLSALTGLDTGRLTSHPVLARTVQAMMEETAAAARQDGVALDRRDVEEMFHLIRTFDPIKTSMLVDREHGRPLELEGICGAVIRRVEAGGGQAPLTSLIRAMLELGS